MSDMPNWSQSITGTAVANMNVRESSGFLWKLASVICYRLAYDDISLRKDVTLYFKKAIEEDRHPNKATLEAWDVAPIIEKRVQEIWNYSEVNWVWFTTTMKMMGVECDLPKEVVSNPRSWLELEGRKLVNLGES